MHENKHRVAILRIYMSNGMAEERHGDGLVVRGC
jgi:hypothetical protein